MGHQVKLISAQYVRPFVKSNMNDYIDAEAICEAASRSAMRFVEPRREAQQLLAALHRAREGLVTERTTTINRIRGVLLEFGIVVPLSRATLRRLPDVLAVQELPLRLIELIHRLHAHYLHLDQQINDVERDLTSQLTKTRALPGYCRFPVSEPLRQAFSHRKSATLPSLLAAGTSRPRSNWYHDSTARASEVSCVESASTATSTCAGS
ncbi:hypothetical protein LMG28690_06938 [Paraburkholderia caffeinilytica]|nr:hypothetical protein LMG28690_06938 [Paraburkholderia caffeinilytica]